MRVTMPASDTHQPGPEAADDALPLPASLLGLLPLELPRVAPLVPRLKLRLTLCLTCPALAALALDPLPLLDALFRPAHAPDADAPDAPDRLPVSLLLRACSVFPFVDPASLLLLHAHALLARDALRGDLASYRGPRAHAENTPVAAAAASGPAPAPSCPSPCSSRGTLASKPPQEGARDTAHAPAHTPAPSCPGEEDPSGVRLVLGRPSRALLRALLSQPVLADGRARQRQLEAEARVARAGEAVEEVLRAATGPDASSVWPSKQTSEEDDLDAYGGEDKGMEVCACGDGDTAGWDAGSREKEHENGASGGLHDTADNVHASTVTHAYCCCPAALTATLREAGVDAVVGAREQGKRLRIELFSEYF
jgi:hypothetical protein